MIQFKRRGETPFMNMSVGLLQRHLIFLMFFVAGIISLFLGDGLQPSVDVFWALTILVLYAVFFIQRREIRPLPRPLAVAWGCLLGYFILRTAFSDSVGYSLSATVRLIEAYLVYHLFYSLVSGKNIGAFCRGIIGVSVVGALASVVYIAAPNALPALPQVNLLYATYGHNHVAGLLVFALAVTLAQRSALPRVLYWALLGLFLGGVVLSFARGAWILLIVYGAYAAFVSKDRSKRSVFLIFVEVFSILLLVTVALTPFVEGKPAVVNKSWLYRQLIRPPVYEQRVYFWGQALSSISKRPVWGSGPGTFSLVSKRLAAASGSYSWYAHSFPLEQFVEVGMVGVVFWLLFVVVQKKAMGRTALTQPLLAGAAALLLYSTFEYALNFLLLWLLLFSSLGAVAGASQRVGYNKGPVFVFPLCFLLALFSLLSLGGSAAASLNRPDTAFYFPPFSSDRAVRLIRSYGTSGAVLTKRQQSALLLFHGKNPDVFEELAVYWRTKGYLDKAQNACVAGIPLDPKNFSYQKICLRNAVERRSPAVGLLLQQFSLNLLPPAFHKQLAAVDFSFASSSLALSPETLDRLDSDWFVMYFAKLYFVLGKDLLSENPQLAEGLWKLSRDISPDVGLFYHELISLDIYVYHNVESAKKTLIDCMKIPRAALHCKQIMPNFENIDQPGSLVDAIMAER